MKKPLISAVIIAATLLIATLVTQPRRSAPPAASVEHLGIVHTLPTSLYDGETSVEQALLERRSVRSYTSEPLTLAEISQLLWAAQGITDPRGGRTAPSAGALYPLEIYLLAGEVTDLPAGIYHFIPDGHALSLVIEGDGRQALYQAALSQNPVKDASAVILITAIYERTTVKYGERGIQYVHMEVGTTAQNIYLQAESLDLGTVFIGAFHDDQVRNVLILTEDEVPLAIMPIGRK